MELNKILNTQNNHLQNQICIFCISRVTKYLTQQSQNIAYILTQFNSITSFSFICKLCLGILSSTTQLINRMQYLIQENGYKFNKFHLTIKLPKSIQLRQWILNIKFNKQFDFNFNAKNFIKKVLVKQIEKKTNFQQSKSNTDALQIGINFENIQDQNNLFSYFVEQLKVLAESKYQSKLKRVQKSIDQSKIQTLKNQMQQILPCEENLKKIKKLNISNSLLQSIFTSKQFSSIKKFNYQIFFNTQSIYLQGKYIKFSRYLPQTPLSQSHLYIPQTTVKQQITKVLVQFLSKNNTQKNIKFHGGGRQDIDVRMLNDGRDFAIQFCTFDTSLKLDLSNLQNQINKSKFIQVKNLTFASKSCLQKIKQVEDSKMKYYSCFIRCSKLIIDSKISELNLIKNLQIRQKTPLRVLHRRSLMARTKKIIKIKAVKIDNLHMMLYILSSAGTYIKQFIHGDLGRTQPNLGVLIQNQCDILQLDVLKIIEKGSNLQDLEKLIQNIDAI